MNKRKNILIPVLLFLWTVLSGARAAAGESFFSDRGQLESYLQTQRPGELGFTCSGDLYRELREGNFRELYRLLARSGIDHINIEISYNDLRSYIGLTSVAYTGLPWAECQTMGDVREMLRVHARDGSDLLLLCTDDLLAQLTGGQLLHVYAAAYGIRSFSSVYSTQTGILRMTGIEYFDRPAAAAEDYAQFSAAVSRFAAQDIRDFYIIFSPELFAAVTGDPAEMTVMLGSSMIAGYAAEIDPNNCVFHFHDTEFTDVPREICRSIEDVSDAIRRMGALGIADFELIFPYTAVFEELYADDFARLLEVRTGAGMVRADISYGSAHDRIIFKNAEIVSEVTALTTLAEAISYTEAEAEAGKKDIHLFCTAELYRLLTEEPARAGTGGGKLVRIYDLVARAGIFEYDITTSGATNLINIRINSLFPGKAILTAVRSGDASRLSERELLTWQAASAAAAVAADPDPLEAAKHVHDWICSHTEYKDDPRTKEDDTAVGAILNGEANCDGYADAFYLIGSLAGLNIGYLHGDSLDRTDLTDPSSVSHLWNLLEIGGVWRMVDVTWDDSENGWSYIWFNIGRDVGERMHAWNEDMTPGIAAETERPFSFGSDFYICSREDLDAAVSEAARRGLVWFHIIFEDPALTVLTETARQKVMDRSADSVLHYSWNEKMSALGFFDVHW